MATFQDVKAELEDLLAVEGGDGGSLGHRVKFNAEYLKVCHIPDHLTATQMKPECCGGQAKDLNRYCRVSWA